MGNKEDWEEIERWNEMKKMEEKEKFGSDFSEIDLNKDFKKVDKIIKGINVTGKTTKTIGIIGIIIAIFLLIVGLDICISNLKNRTNVKVIETMEKMYNTKISIVSKNIDENENGIYKLKRKDNENIQFTAIKDFGSMTEDYLDNCHKYYFDNWNDDRKSLFIIEDTKKDELLNYSTYIVINTLDDLKNAMTAINDFVRYCNDNFSPAWDIYMLKEEHRIYPYTNSNMTAEEATNNAEKIFENLSEEV